MSLNYEKAKKIANEMHRVIESGKTVIISNRELRYVHEENGAFTLSDEKGEEFYTFNEKVGSFTFCTMAKWAKVFDAYAYPWEKEV